MLNFHELPAYDIRYSHRSSQARTVLMQQQKIRKAIRDEHRVLSNLASSLNPIGIISDNRYGCYQKNIPSVLITHQLHLPGVPSLLQHLADRIMMRYLKNFDSIWIPDEPETPNLSGRLSHPALKSIPCQYLGLLSRFESYEQSPKEFDILVILSGPEPQRTLLEEKVIAQLSSLNEKKCCIVRGTHLPITHPTFAEALNIMDMADSALLKVLIEKSEWIICRSGYSSLMDLQHSGKKLLLIPTPGQSEQEYLAQHFSTFRNVILQNQSSLDIQMAIQSDYMDNNKSFDVNKGYKNIVNLWLNSL